jgi:CheY-like chemotaxis protein
MREILEDKKILIVDDDESTIAPLRALLRNKGAWVTYESQLDQAKKRLETEEAFDLVIIDLRFNDELPESLKYFLLPNLNDPKKEHKLYGAALASWIIDGRKDLKFVFYTILPDKNPDLEHRGNSVQVIDKLKTPLLEVVSTIEKMLRSEAMNV